MAETKETTNEQQNAEKERTRWGKFKLFEIAGIQITIDYSWLIIFLLVAWGLSAGYFPRLFPDYSAGFYWVAGIIAALLLFVSILIHELSHSITAIRTGIKIPEITLFIFGGVAKLSQEPTNPKTELKIAVAGPLASFVLALVFGILARVLGGPAPGMVVGIFTYLAWINLALGIFNLVPGYPLDGGRILRALVWWRTGSVARATRLASNIGQGFAWALMILGGVQIFMGELIGGLWLIFIGMFLRGIAASGYQEVMVKQSLEGVPVKYLLVENPVTIGPEVTLERAVSEYFLRYGHGGFPVVQQGKALGLLSLAQIKDVPEEARKSKTAGEVMIPLGEDIRILPEESLLEAFKKMTRSGIGRLLVMRDNEMVGMITKTGMLRFLDIKRLLEE